MTPMKTLLLALTPGLADAQAPLHAGGEYDGTCAHIGITGCDPVAWRSRAARPIAAAERKRSELYR